MSWYASSSSMYLAITTPFGVLNMTGVRNENYQDGKPNAESAQV